MTSLRDQILGIPEQFDREPECMGTLPDQGRLLICAMGGSAMAGEFLALGLAAQRECLVVRRDTLPVTSDGDIVLCISYSGNTGETLALWEAAGTRNLRRAAVSSGGRLNEFARAVDAPRAVIQAGNAPRTALGYLIRGAWSVFGDGGAPSWTEAGKHLSAVRALWGGQADGDTSLSGLLEALDGSLPVITADEPHQVLAARRWVADLAENAKIPALLWEFPEAAHNLIMAASLEAPNTHPLQFIVLGQPREASAVRRWRETAGLLREHGARMVPLAVPHPDPWMESLGLAYVGSLVSLHLARRLGVDPASLSIMDELKRRLETDSGKDKPKS